MEASWDDGYRLPGVSRAGIRQEIQLKPHESFTQEAISLRAEVDYVKVGEGPDKPFGATPPDWTEQADCLGDYYLFDKPNADVFHKRVKPRCMGCPVREQCLQDALEAEGDLPSGLRETVRGGLRPFERANLVGAKKKKAGYVDPAYLAEPVVCPVCEEKMRRSSLSRHINRMHDDGMENVA